MQAFISYSISDGDEFVLTLLGSKLREKNFVLTTSQNFYAKNLDHQTMQEIKTSHLFVGLITGTGTERARVLEEWNYAVQQHIPNLLLVEDTVPVHQSFNGNYLIFNRNQPQAAVDEIQRRMNPAQTSPSTNPEALVPWL